MSQDLLDRMDTCLQDAAQHAARALLLLDRLSTAPGVAAHPAYAEVHTVLADLAGARILLSISG